MTKTPVLFVHAFPLDSRMWQPQLAVLEDSRRVLAPDLRGFGKNRLGASPESIEQHARDMLDHLDEQSVARGVVVGCSMGGYIALAMHRLAPERIAGLVLADTKAAADTPEAKKGRDVRIDKVRREGMSRLPDELIESLVAPQCPQSVRLELRRIMLEQTPDTVIAALRCLRDRPDSTSSMRAIRVPTMLICGQHDTLTPPSVMEEMHRQIPGSSFEVIAGAGHLSNLEVPPAFNQALVSFLGRS